MTIYRFAKYSFIALVFLTLLTPLIMFRDWLYPFITSKAFFARILIELALPFYIYLIIRRPLLRPKWKHPLSLLIVIFFAVDLISAFFGVDFAKSFWGVFERMDSVFTHAHWVLLYFYILLLGKLDGKYLERYLLAFIGVSTLTCLNGISGFLGGPTLMPDMSLPARASSTFGNPIFFASFLLLPMFLAGFFASKAESRKAKIFFWAIFAVHMLAIVFSATRGAIIGLAVGGAVAGVIYAALQPSRKIKLISVAALGGLALFAALLFIYPQLVPKGLNLRRLFILKDSNTQARLIQWRVALRGVKDYPFLGTGGNNYYYVSNKYYNPEIWKFDPQWFDKPHNYQLEILVTNGVLGFMSYLSVVMFIVWILYKAFKAGSLSLTEMGLLLAGFFAYQIQNLFVFDTVSASLAFYVFLGFAGYLWTEIGVFKEAKPNDGSPTFSGMALCLGIPAALYLAYAANWTGGQISRNLNFAKLLEQRDFDEAKLLLDKSVNSSFNFYWKDVAYEYSNFAAWYSNRNQPQEQLNKSKEMMKQAVAVSERAAKEHPKDPTVWMKLSNARFARSHLENTGFNQQAYDDAFKAYALAPKKHDPKLLMAAVAIDGKRPDLAEKWLDEVLADYPTLEDARWQLANLYYFSGRKPESEELARQAIAGRYRLDKISKGDWLLTYYYESHEPQKALDFLLTQAAGREKDVSYFERLADAYNKSGHFAEARSAAMKVLELDPSSKTEVEAFIKSLPINH